MGNAHARHEQRVAAQGVDVAGPLDERDCVRPQVVSEQLGVLSIEVLNPEEIDVRDRGRQRLYRLNGRALKPIHDWVKDYERSWSERFDRLEDVLEDLKREEEGDGRDE